MSLTREQPYPIIAELTGLFFITILITGLVVFTDIRIFDDYIGLAIKTCHADNQELLCILLRQKQNLASDEQIGIGNSYWGLLVIQAVVIPISFSAFRFLTIAVRKRKFTDLRILIIILWGLVPFILFYFGSIDVFYYVGRGMEIPDQLDWLNNAGIFQYTKMFGIDPLNVERNDLLLTFGLGVGFIVLLFFIATKMYEHSRLRGMV